MGSRVQKIAFLIFALMFVAVMAILNTSILTLGTSANEQLTSVVTADDTALSIYDQKTVYGNTVMNCAKDPAAVSTNITDIFVITNDELTAHQYNDAAKYDPAVGTGTGRINSTAKFDAYLCYNTNNVFTGILFVQQGASAPDVSTVTAAGLTVQGTVA